MKWTFLKVYLSAIKHRVLYFHGFRLFTLKEEKKVYGWNAKKITEN